MQSIAGKRALPVRLFGVCSVEVERGALRLKLPVEIISIREFTVVVAHERGRRNGLYSPRSSRLRGDGGGLIKVSSSTGGQLSTSSIEEKCRRGSVPRCGTSNGIKQPHEQKRADG